MKSLFLRIFLSFWLAQALFLVLAILVTVALRPTRQISAVEALQSKYLNDVVEVYQTGGTEKARDYLRNLRDTQRVRAFLFNEQGSVLGHSPPPFVADVASGKIR